MRVTRTSPFTGITRTMELDITYAQWDAWQSGVLLQDVFPNLTPGQREFLKTGITDEEWDEYLGAEQ